MPSIKDYRSASRVIRGPSARRPLSSLSIEDIIRQRMMSRDWFAYLWQGGTFPQDATGAGDDTVWQTVDTLIRFGWERPGLGFATAGTGADEANLEATAATSMAGAANFWNTANEPGLIVRMSSDTDELGGQNIRNKNEVFGFKLTADGDPDVDDDQATWTNSPGDDPVPWRTRTSVAGRDESREWGTAIDYITPYELAVLLDEGRRPHYFFNGDFVHRGPALRALNTIIPVVGEEETAAASVDMFVQQIFVCQRWVAR
jgi:hypothetical protein